MNANVQAEYNRVIQHAISLDIEAGAFLTCWNEGDWEGCLEYDFTPDLEAMKGDAPKPSDIGLHKKAYIYVPGNYDIGEIELTGFTIIADADLAALQAGVPVQKPAPLSPEAAKRLRGLIALHARCEYNAASAGAQMPEDAKLIRADAKRASKAVYAFLLSLTEPK